MSKTKAVDVFGRRVWVWENAHDVVVAHMVEVAAGVPGLEQSQVADWRVAASIGDLGLHIAHCSPADKRALDEVLARVRARVIDHGDVTREDVAGWFVLDTVPVSGGFLRTDPLGSGALLDVVDGFAAMVAGMLPDAPPGHWWLLGAPGGRTVIMMGGDA